jgi:hypothetical protein
MTDPARLRRPSPVAALVVAGIVGVAAAGCLPTGTRGSPGLGDGASSASPVTSQAPASGGPTPSPRYVTPTPTPAPTFATYTVARGDTLHSIADRFGTTARSIAYWNRATYPSLDPEGAGYRPNLLQVGWVLQVIPNTQFDEQTLPEPSDLQGTPPTPKPTGDIEYEDDSPSPS